MRLARQVTYEAKDEAESLVIAKERLGRDAVILSSQRVKRGGFLGFFRKEVLQVTAGIFEEDREPDQEASADRIKAFQRLLEVKQAVKEAMPQVAGEHSQAAGAASGQNETSGERESREGVTFEISPQAKAMARNAAQQSPPAAEQDEKVQSVSRRVEELQQSLEEVLTRLDAWDSEKADPGTTAEAEPVDPRVARLTGQGVAEQHARALVERFRAESDSRPFPDWLNATVPVLGSDFAQTLGGNRVMFIGPTGVGKTTTIAKLAAVFSLWERKSVLFLTADTYRIAAVEQLRTYARILGVPLEVIYEPHNIEEILKKQQDKEILLMDTAGRSHRNSERLEELRELYEHFQPDAVHLLLAANMKYTDMLDVVEQMAVVPVTSFLFTKLDETGSYADIFNVVMDFNVPLSFFTVGQNVPNDIEVASPSTVVESLVGGEPVESA
ncbi:MAG: flagellar biosynthesis protein FlhF [Synergistales bacterium]|nr:flagellar biosynthesis protein FlhF [Synergistales bacterium]